MSKILSTVLEIKPASERYSLALVLYHYVVMLTGRTKETGTNELVLAAISAHYDSLSLQECREQWLWGIFCEGQLLAALPRSI